MKRVLYNISKFFAIIILLFSIACKQKEELQQQKNIPSRATNLTKEELQTVHRDTNYKYKYRTGSSGDYTYNYNVSGFDDTGKEVTGYVTMEDKYGVGTIAYLDGIEIEVEVEWINNGLLKATDQDGNQYELTVD